MTPIFKSIPGGIEMRVKVVPGATRDRIVGPHGDALKVQVSAPPERGKANAAVIRLIAGRLGVAPKCVSVVRGAASPNKVIRIAGVAAAAVEEAIR